MVDFFGALIAGLALGSLLSLAATGLVLTYTTSGIFNFAHGAVAMLAAFAFYEVNQVWGWPTWLSFVVVAFIATPMLQLGIYALIVRRLKGTAEITKLVVTIALMLAMFGLAQWAWNPQGLYSIPVFWMPSGELSLHVGSGASGTVYLEAFQVFCFAVAVLFALSLAWLFKRTRAGLAMRAAVDNADLLQLNGGLPFRVEALSWALGGVTAGVAGILIAQIQGQIDATSLTELILTCAVTAAMVGRLRSVPATLLGGLLVGCATTFFNTYAPQSWSAWAPALAVSIPVLCLFVVLLVLPNDRVRGAKILGRRERFSVPTMPRSYAAGAALVVTVLLLSVIMGDSSALTMAQGIALGVVALSLTVLTGYAGEINLAPISLGAVAGMVAYHVGLIGQLNFQSARLSLLGVLAGVLAAAVVGALVALPALRLHGLYLALATMGFAIFLSNFILSFTGPVELPLIHLHLSFMEGGSLYLPPIKLFAWSITTPRAQLVANAAVFAVLGVAIIALRRSAYGRRLVAMKDSTAAVTTLGQNVLWLKVSVFMVSSAIAGLGGILYCVSLGQVQNTSFDVMLSLALVMATVVGGVGSVSGALIGGLGIGVGLQVLQLTFHNLALDHNQVGQFFGWGTAEHLAALLPATIGITMGSNPSGSVENIVESFRPVLENAKVLVATLAALVVAFALTATHVWGDWWFVFAFGVIGVAAPAFAQHLAPSTTGTPSEAPSLSLTA